jgi:hypothetical protein
MKKVVFAMLLMASPSLISQTACLDYYTWANVQADYHAVELKIDVKEKIKYYDIVLEVDEMYYPVTARRVKGTTITLLLSAYQNYYVRINDDIKIYLSALGHEVIDERDLIIRSEVNYNFKKGVLVFNYPFKRERKLYPDYSDEILSSGSKDCIFYDKPKKKKKKSKRKKKKGQLDSWKASKKHRCNGRRK